MFETIEKEILSFQKETKKILIIGLGQIGYSNAEYMTKLGLHVEGLDINKEAIHRALQHNVIQKEATNCVPKQSQL